MMRFGTYRTVSGILAAALITAAATAQSGSGQSAATQPAPGPRLDIPQEVNFVPTRTGPVVARATAIVNDEIITQSDVNQRVALRVAAARAAVPPEQMERFARRCCAT
jgi:peptidyl-prolyl cis-trans isomerase SurA